MRKQLFILAISLMFISLASAASYTFKMGDYVDYHFKCIDNNGNFCSPSTILSISIDNQNGTNIINNQTMHGESTFFNYSLPTSDLGTYHVFIIAPGNNATSEFYYLVTAQGIEYSIGQSIIYFILFIVLLTIFIGSIYGFLVIPFNNPRGGDGEVVYVDYKKYFKIGLLALSYVCFIGITFFAWNISYGILQFSSMANFFYFLFRTAFILMFPAFVILFVFGTIRLVKDMKIAKELFRGLSVYD